MLHAPLPSRRTRSKHLGIVTILAVLVCAACDTGPATAPAAGPASAPAPIPPDPADTTLHPGGSNYVMYSIGDYLEDPSWENWIEPFTLRPVIGTYHMDPDRVRRQLAQMYASGQRRIALVLWHANFWWDPSYAQREVRGHVVNSGFGRIIEQHEDNVRAVVNDIADAGFEELIFRFASQWSSDPRGWTQWEETRYRRNWSVIRQMKAVVDPVAGRRGLAVLYDLELELGGLGQGERQVRRYARRLWTDYTEAYGSADAIGFSVSLKPGRITRAIEDYDAAGPRPAIYGVDIYRREYRGLERLKEELTAAGEPRKRVILQEVHYNDRESADQIGRARRDHDLNIAYVLQWPYTRGLRHIPHFHVDYPAEYDAYLPLAF